ncbi:uncharacterized protein [Zea mays]|uniref:uncharacterized protein n=1 Tax=Zea mays TaxID=4577 RepID=UPI0009AAB020|nr:uncharacterized protein LOC109939271 [Zea mays]|eukprot:XP_020397262.1 uncharacterized protein LOC109939271 [Zea mays]
MMMTEEDEKGKEIEKIHVDGTNKFVTEDNIFSEDEITNFQQHILEIIGSTQMAGRRFTQNGSSSTQIYAQMTLPYVSNQGGYMDLMMEQIRNSQGEPVSELGNEMQSALCTQNETMNKNLLVAPCETYTQMILEEDSTLANADISKFGYMDLMMEQIYNSQGESVSEVGNEMQSGLCTQNETMNNNLIGAPCETYTQMILEEDSPLANADISKETFGECNEADTSKYGEAVYHGDLFEIMHVQQLTECAQNDDGKETKTSSASANFDD